LLSRAVASRSSSGGVALHLEEIVGHGGHADAAQAVGQGVGQHRLSFQ
jgi:hypothetical protein